MSSLDSSFRQTYTNVERIVIDGGSNDGTQQVLNQQSYALDRVLSEPDNGIYDALNKGIKYSSGDIIGVLHSDDMFANNKVLATVAETFFQTGADFLYGDLCYVRKGCVNEIVRYWKAKNFTYSLLNKGWMPPHPTVFAKRKVFDIFGEYELRYSISSDYDWMLRVLVNDNINVVYLPEILVKMQTGGVSNRSIKNLIKKSFEDYEIVRSHGIGGIYTVFLKNLRKIPQFWANNGNLFKYG